MTAKEHYDRHLANFYAWMVGDFAQKQMELEEYFASRNIFPFDNGVAFDLGAGHGLQTISLAKLGFSVHAVDFNRRLLEDLNSRKGGLSIESHECDILKFLKGTDIGAELIVCMGDTLTHFKKLQDIQLLFELSYKHLTTKGKLILSFRDFTQKLTGNDRFIPVRSDDNRMLICFLEYHPYKVQVHDIVVEKNNGSLAQKISSYAKLRINETIVSQLLIKENFSVVLWERINRMIYIIAEKN
jgi:hypothetical protein